EIENQESSKPPEDADADEFKIFFADVPESLRKTKRLAVSRLTQEKIQVLETIPPPYPAEEHDSAVIEQIK
ncbi:hypothetical protein GWO43_03425, partial [candidate division KSB1 bacterium]|nr:hypothetical protein [candidate division KSB1 bacterium]NIR70350.1 hypothetical protein [candidate division KSB1 bacterium]NIS23120.1 hypothetical protein [candidate division KSB1 bacterium]NIT69955.1 hypothetical protein [candidate division KSB1 bacterium]NIU23614.1 hypothetical protein [candidate division KSB1 bacterium]